MAKRFNITGTCIPNKHYMVDTSDKINKIMKLIEDDEYFIINRPRQYGKTTTLYMLERFLNKDSDYLVLSISFEGIGDLIFENETRFAKGFLKILKRNIELENIEIAEFVNKEKDEVEDLDDLSSLITRLVKKINKKVVLMIDEVDKSSNNQLFLSFLGMLRNKYLLRNEGNDYTFHSVILAGMYILELKRWNGEEYHKKGLIQLGEYLEQYGLDEGYLLIFDFRKLSGQIGTLEETVVTLGEKEKLIVEAYC